MQTPIAIIGIGCRFPGASGPRAFWKLLSEGKNAITRMPGERHALGWNPNGLNDPWGGYLQDIDRFDANFFGISPEEARGMDPQQRLLLETAWEALEDAAIIPKSLAGSETSVYMGISSHNYASIIQNYPDAIDRFSNTGTGASVAANRIAYFLDLQGPGFCVDGACASSLLAVHLACQSIRTNESRVALAGGANVTLLSGPTLGLSRSGMMSPDGECRIFDAGANGSVRGEGAAVVVLKSLAQAQADGDPIYAVIIGGAVNQNGRSNGLGAPNRRAQEALLRQAYQSAGISPGKVQHLETHSTASLIGDATELAAAGAIFQDGRAAGDVCRVGSVKPNIGHLEAAAGIAGLIKTALMLHYQQMTPTLNFRTPNPHVPLDRLALQIQTELAPWPGKAGERIAGVSATGYGGVNVHVVLGDAPVRGEHETHLSAAGALAGGIRVDTEEPPARAPAALEEERETPLRPHLFTLSAKTQPALRQNAGEISGWIDAALDVELADICHTANFHRTRYPVRLAIIADDRRQLVERLREFAEGHPGPLCFHDTICPKQSGENRIEAAADDDAPTREARAFVFGKQLDSIASSSGGRRIHGLPGYSFQRETYWLPTSAPVPAERGATTIHDGSPSKNLDAGSEVLRRAGSNPKESGSSEYLRTGVIGEHKSISIESPSPSIKILRDTAAIPSSTERRVVSLFEQVLVVSPIRLDDNFFDLGGRSAQVLELFSHVERAFGKTLPLIHFYESPTPRHLASMIAMDQNAIHWKPVITLNEGGRQPALFFVPGLGGHAFAMRTFAERLGPDQPISVLHPQGLDPHTVALTSIEEMARVFVTYIRSTQPHGPYHLGGYSFGGSVAFEMACQLQTQGETVKTLTLLDAYAPGAFQKRSLPHRLMNHAKMIYSSSHRKEYMKRRMGKLWDRLRAAATGEEFHTIGKKPAGAIVDAVRRVTFANQQAWRAYRPGRFNGDISLFRAADTDPMISQFAHCDERNGWSAHASGVDLLVLPCHHLKLFEGASLDLMTERIAALLQTPDTRVIVLPTPMQTKVRAGA